MKSLGSKPRRYVSRAITSAMLASTVRLMRSAASSTGMPSGVATRDSIAFTASSRFKRILPPK